MDKHRIHNISCQCCQTTVVKNILRITTLLNTSQTLFFETSTSCCFIQLISNLRWLFRSSELRGWCLRSVCSDDIRTDVQCVLQGDDGNFSWSVLPSRRWFNHTSYFYIFVSTNTNVWHSTSTWWLIDRYYYYLPSNLETNVLKVKI